MALEYWYVCCFSIIVLIATFYNLSKLNLKNPKQKDIILLLINKVIIFAALFLLFPIDVQIKIGFVIACFILINAAIMRINKMPC